MKQMYSVTAKCGKKVLFHQTTLNRRKVQSLVRAALDKSLGFELDIIVMSRFLS